MSMINKEIEDFSVQAFHGDDFITVTKDDVLGHWSVFFFYPADFTFVCPTELEDLAALYDQFKAADCEIYSVSCDTHFVHKAWHDASENIKNLPYPMLADPTHKLADIFDVYIEEDGVAERGSFIVNPEGRICLLYTSAQRLADDGNDVACYRILDAVHGYLLYPPVFSIVRDTYRIMKHFLDDEELKQEGEPAWLGLLGTD